MKFAIGLISGIIIFVVLHTLTLAFGIFGSVGSFLISMLWVSVFRSKGRNSNEQQ